MDRIQNAIDVFEAKSKAIFAEHGSSENQVRQAHNEGREYAEYLFRDAYREALVEAVSSIIGELKADLNKVA